VEYNPNSPRYNISPTQYSYNPTPCSQYVAEVSTSKKKQNHFSDTNNLYNHHIKVPTLPAKESYISSKEHFPLSQAPSQPIEGSEPLPPTSSYLAPLQGMGTVETGHNKRLLHLRHSTPPHQSSASKSGNRSSKMYVSARTFNNLPSISYKPAALSPEECESEFNWWILPRGYSEVTQKSGQRFLIIRGKAYDATCFFFQIERDTSLFRPAFANLPNEYYDLLNKCIRWDGTHSGASPINIKYMALSLQNNIVARETGWSQNNTAHNVFDNKNVNQSVYNHVLDELEGKKNTFKPPTLILNAVDSDINIFDGEPLDNSHLKHSATIEASLRAVPSEQLRKIRTTDLALFAKTLELTTMVTNSVNALADPQMSHHDRLKEAKHVASSAHLMMRYQREAFTKCTVPILRAKQEARKYAFKDIQCNIAKDLLERDNLFSRSLFSSNALQRASEALEEKNFQSIHITVSGNLDQNSHIYVEEKRSNFTNAEN